MDGMDSPGGRVVWVGGGVAASPGHSGSWPEPDGGPWASGGARGWGGCSEAASTAPIISAATVSSTQIPSDRNAPLPTQNEGRPIQGTRMQALLRMLRRASGAVSGRALASPLVTSEPSLLMATSL